MRGDNLARPSSGDKVWLQPVRYWVSGVRWSMQKSKLVVPLMEVGTCHCSPTMVSATVEVRAVPPVPKQFVDVLEKWTVAQSQQLFCGSHPA